MPASTYTSETLAQIIRDGVSGYLIGGRFVPRMAGAEDDDDKKDDPPKGDEGDKGKDGEPFDAARAQRTIDKLRESEREGKAAQKQLTDALARLKAIEDKDKSETEKATAAAKEASDKLAAAEARLAEERLGRIVERAAGKAGFHDPDDAFRLIDRKAVELDEDGEPKNIHALLTALAKAKPHLVKADGDDKKTTASRGTAGTPKPDTKAPTRDQLIEEKKKQLRQSGSYSRIG